MLRFVCSGQIDTAKGHACVEEKEHDRIKISFYRKNLDESKNQEEMME